MWPPTDSHGGHSDCISLNILISALCLCLRAVIVLSAPKASSRTRPISSFLKSETDTTRPIHAEVSHSTTDSKQGKGKSLSYFSVGEK